MTTERKGRTISHHLLRRKAREAEKRIEALQLKGSEGRYDEADAARRQLYALYGLTIESRVKTKSTVRGPWGWKVVTW